MHVCIRLTHACAHARLHRATVTAYSVGGAPLASFTVSAARDVYVWTLRNRPLPGVSRIEVKMPKPSGCLHFAELEAFGYPEALEGSDAITYGELPERAPPSSAEQPPRQTSTAVDAAEASTPVGDQTDRPSLLCDL